MGIDGLGQPRWQSLPCWRVWIRFPEYSAHRLLERRLGVSAEHWPVDLVEGFHRRESTRDLYLDSIRLLSAELHEQRHWSAAGRGTLGTRLIWVCLHVRGRRLRLYRRRSLRRTQRCLAVPAVPDELGKLVVFAELR